MKTVIEYYQDLWMQKSGKKPYQQKKRDMLHRWFLDLLFDPQKHDRASLAGELIGTEASGKLLDIGCWGGSLCKE